MPADHPHVGMGRRRTHQDDLLASDERNRTLEKAIDRDAQREADDVERLLDDSARDENERER